MTNKITYFGSERDIKEAAKILNKHRSFTSMKEGKARLKIQELIDKHNLKATILFNGNNVWSKTRVLLNLHRIIKHGALYNTEDQSKPPILSHYFYEFLHQDCGSIAHYDIHGWIHVYPTIEDLRKFFMKNEFGKRVLDWIPEWETDVKAIVEAIEGTLFPFKTYMQTQKQQ